MRVLLVLNENPLGSHPDLYELFDRLSTDGVISGFDVVPYSLMRAEGHHDQHIVGHILDTLRAGGHELIVWMHTLSLDVDSASLDQIIALPQKPSMVYWEGDSYHTVYNPMPRAMRRLVSRCDHAYFMCGGSVVRSLGGSTCEVRYAPSCASGTRFPHVWEAHDSSDDASIVMIANSNQSRIPIRRWPGGRERVRIVAALERRYGTRFAVYGSGWRGRSARGPCEFNDQVAVYRRAVVAVGADNSTLPLAFSNRLPIALAVGIPLLYNDVSSSDDVFPTEMQNIFYHDEAHLFQRIDALLDSDSSDLHRLSLEERRFFEDNLSRSVVGRFIVGRVLGHRARLGMKSNRQIEVDMKAVNMSTAVWQRVPPLARRGR